MRALAVAMVLVIPSIALPAKNHQGLERPATEADLLRGFAFGRCLAKAFPGSEVAADAERAADLYMQMGKLTGDIYERATKMAESEALGAMVPLPPTGKPLAVLSCLEFYESPELKKIAKKAK